MYLRVCLSHKHICCKVFETSRTKNKNKTAKKIAKVVLFKMSNIWINERKYYVIYLENNQSLTGSYEVRYS